MHSLFPVGSDDAPLAPAMTWADQRAASEARVLRTRADAHALYLRTGCPLQAIYHPAKLRWWVENTSLGASRFVAIKDFVAHQLTGAWATDLCLASATGVLDVHRLAWDDEALALAEVSASQLPALVAPDATLGRIPSAAAALTGLPEGLPVIAGGSDGGLANVGAGASTPGEIVVTVGTSGAVRKIVDRPLLDPRERTWCYVLDAGRWFAGGAINNGGLALQWARDQLYPDEASYDHLLADAAQIAPGADGLICLPYFTGERSPHWNPEARAVMHGLSLRHTRGHLARAVLEGVAFCLADVWQALGGGQAARLTGGITRASLWARIVADVLGARLSLVDAADASAVGAALVGHHALGNALTLKVEPSTVIAPYEGRHALYASRHQVFQSLYRQVFGQ
jgi:gluconokinase